MKKILVLGGWLFSVACVNKETIAIESLNAERKQIESPASVGYLNAPSNQGAMCIMPNGMILLMNNWINTGDTIQHVDMNVIKQ